MENALLRRRNGKIVQIKWFKQVRNSARFVGLFKPCSGHADPGVYAFGLCTQLLHVATKRGFAATQRDDVVGHQPAKLTL